MSVQEPWIPIFIRPALAEWSYRELDNSLEKTLRSGLYGVSDTKALTHKKLLFIVDAWDELKDRGSKKNLYEHLQLSRFPNAKLVVTCRRHIVNRAEEAKIFGKEGQVDVRFVMPFDTQQTLRYLQQRLYWSEEETATFADKLEESSELRERLRNPFVLSLLVESWPSFKGKDLTQLNRAQIYEISIRHWLMTQHTRLSKEVQTRLVGMAGGNLATSFLACGKFLAAQGFIEHSVSISRSQATAALPPSLHAWLHLDVIVRETAASIFQTRRRAQASSQQHRSILTEADYVFLQLISLAEFLRQSPLKLRLARVEYRHRSLYEYLLAQAIVSALQQRDLPRLKVILRPQPIQNESATMEFFREIYQAQSPEIQQWQLLLKQVVVDSRTTPGIGQASANGATLMNACDIPLSRMDLREVKYTRRRFKLLPLYRIAIYRVQI